MILTDLLRLASVADSLQPQFQPMSPPQLQARPSTNDPMVAVLAYLLKSDGDIDRDELIDVIITAIYPDNPVIEELFKKKPKRKRK